MADRRPPSAPSYRGPSRVVSGLVGVLLWCALARPELAEALAGALVVGMVAAAVRRACPIARADFAPWSAIAAAAVRRGPGLLWQIAGDSARLTLAALAPGRVAGEMQQRAFDPRGHDRVAPPAVLAAAVTATTLSPASVVLGLGPHHDGLRVHVLPAGEGGP